jgi:uncharacterized protein with von Willebrand factor type A (vWA) domain
MNKSSLSFPLMLSFNELAWIAAFALLILYAVASNDEQLLRNQSSKTELSSPITVPREDVVNRELLGLEGRLDNVAIVVDMSGSMRAHWPKVQRVVKTWLEHLPIKRCALIMFADSVQQFPLDGGFADVQGSEGDNNRREIINQFAVVTPHGNTNTLLALKTAYTYRDIDTIILFTDGFPDLGNNRFDKRFAQQIYELVARHRSVIINTVGLGHYFDRRFGEFLFRLPQETGGSYLGF